LACSYFFLPIFSLTVLIKLFLLKKEVYFQGRV